MSGKSSSNEKNDLDIERLTKLEKLIQMRQDALKINDRLMGSDIDAVVTAEKDLAKLRDQFFDENQDMMTPQQHESAKKDFGYFLTLLELAIGYHMPATCENNTVD
jgi:hypothetical protein